VRMDLPKSPCTTFLTYRLYCTGNGLSRPRWCVRISMSRCVALTSSSRFTGFPDRRVRTKTKLSTPRQRSNALKKHPARELIKPPPLAAVRHILPVVEPHVAGNQGPFAHLRPHPNNGMHGPNGHTGNVLMEPGPPLVAHDAHAFRLIGLGGEVLDERI